MRSSDRRIVQSMATRTLGRGWTRTTNPKGNHQAADGSRRSSLLARLDRSPNMPPTWSSATADRPQARSSCFQHRGAHRLSHHSSATGGGPGWRFGLVAAVAALSALTACGGGTSSATKTTTTPSSAAGVTTQRTVTTGAAATITTADGFRYQLTARKPTLVTQYGSGGGTPIVAPLGMDFISVPIAISNLQTDRAASIETPLADLNFYVPRAVAGSFGKDPSLAHLGLSVTDCTSPLAAAGAAPPANCVLQRGDYGGAKFAYDENGNSIDVGYGLAPPIGPGSTANVTIYSFQVSSGSPLASVLLYYGRRGTAMTPVPLP